ncbi:uncharacterized protein LOC100680135 [Nasonia vitripennis]|uniref:Uncharacterized protein n=1 Tax=Nasonia vitripennis TaxID=7425 RepID=A0A7M7GBI8_NASVI|nr:uncharacterized protein LOC100680135 [Nasonia vitripennis]
MDGESLESILSTCQALADRGEYEQALSCLNSMECVMACWMRGKIYLAAAEQLSKEFLFVFYRTAEMNLRYEELLSKAHDHLNKTVELLSDASCEVKEYLNKSLWNLISKVQNAIILNRPVVEEEKFEIYEEDNSYVDVWAENLIDDISDWKLT